MPEICRILGVSIGPGGLPKSPQGGQVLLSVEGFANDKHRYRLHGGPDKAVCVYCEDDYLELEDQGCKPPNDDEWSIGAFGENLTIDGIRSQRVRLGSCFFTGTVVMQVTQPRQPCNNLNVYGPRMRKTLEQQLRTGFYMKVLQGGALQAGEELYYENLRGMTIEQVNHLFYVQMRSGSPQQRRAAAETLLATENLSEDFKTLVHKSRIMSLDQGASN